MQNSHPIHLITPQTIFESSVNNFYTHDLSRKIVLFFNKLKEVKNHDVKFCMKNLWENFIEEPIYKEEPAT